MKASELFQFRGPEKTGNGGITVACQQHAAAGRSDRGHACAVRVMMTGWGLYAEAHRERFKSPIGDDGVLGWEWQAIGRGLLGLLNGETGGFDGGSLDANIRAFMREHGCRDE